MREALKLAIEALYFLPASSPAQNELQDAAIEAIKEALAQEKALQALHDENERLGLYKDAYAQPEEEKLHPIHIGVDVTKEGTAVTAFYRKPNAVMEMFYSQFHPMAQPEQESVAMADYMNLMEKYVALLSAQPEQKRPPNCGTGYCSCIECVMEPEQEPAYRCRPYSSVPNAKVSEPVDYYTTPPQRKPLTDEQKQELIGNYFAEDWAQKAAKGLLHDYEIKAAHGIKE